MPRQSAGILLYRKRGASIEVLLVHPGGPFWAKKDLGAWSIPKGEPDIGEALIDAARREFEEETGFKLPAGEMIQLTPITQKAGKVVHAWAVQGDIDASAVRSNTTKAQWPPKSGKWIHFPEVDRAAYFPLSEARERINPAQIALLDQLKGQLAL